MSRALPSLLTERLTGDDAGVTSVCSAHPMVIEAALAHGARTGRRVLIEATCNQVNQEGGYTAMTPADFLAFVEAIASKVGFDPSRIVLGGDHLGPNPWKNLPAEEALARAEAMVAAYASAGFEKIHLDASMGCAGEPAGLRDDIAAARAARLAEVAEAAGAPRPIVYVIGTEVPTPGGMGQELEVHVTEPDAVRATIEAHEKAFRVRGLEAAFARVIALVVQPGVEFGASAVVRYDRAKAQQLSAVLNDLPQFVFEAHSTDYQTRAALTALVADGFAIVKVGPALTFALREALYGLDHIAEALLGTSEASLRAVMERVMTDDPRYWAGYYGGGPTEQRLLRHFSLSDRIRYYWAKPQAVQAVDRLLERMRGLRIPPPLAHQFLPGFDLDTDVQLTARDSICAAVVRVLGDYSAACANALKAPRRPLGRPARTRS